MRFCLYCKRLNPGHPLFCQYCGHSFEVRICMSCHHLNPVEALACRRCGNSNFSEPSGLLPSWFIFIKVFLWILGFLLLFGLVKTLVQNMELLLAVVLPFGFLYLGYLFLPQPLQGLIKKMLKAVKGFILNKRNNNIQNGE